MQSTSFISTFKPYMKFNDSRNNTFEKKFNVFCCETYMLFSLNGRVLKTITVDVI